MLPNADVPETSPRRRNLIAVAVAAVLAIGGTVVAITVSGGSRSGALQPLENTIAPVSTIAPISGIDGCALRAQSALVCAASTTALLVATTAPLVATTAPILTIGGWAEPCVINGPHLTGLDLDLSGFDLTGRSFLNVNFAGVNLTNATLTGANFTGACLMTTKFISANLTGAKFTGADITGADFKDATLTGVISSGIIGVPTALPIGWVLVGGVLKPG